LIEEIGTIVSCAASNTGLELEVEGDAVLENLKIDDSVAIDGICLTVVAIENRTFTVQAVAETVSLTTASEFNTGRKVNLERALRADGRFGGHFVQGHVDCVAVVESCNSQGEGKILALRLPKEYSHYLVPKGSIAVSGVSLTVAELQGDTCIIWLIPHTLATTILGSLAEGDRVNIEVDILGKYVAHYLAHGEQKNGLSEQDMNEWGYSLD
jgi:riboflavin synthase